MCMILMIDEPLSALVYLTDIELDFWVAGSRLALALDRYNGSICTLYRFEFVGIQYLVSVAPRALL